MSFWTYTLSAWIFSRKKNWVRWFDMAGRGFLFVQGCFLVAWKCDYWNDELWVNSRTERKATNKQSIIEARLSVLWLWLVIIFLLFLLLHKTCTSYIALNLAYLYQILWKPAIFDCFYLHYPNYLYTLYISVNGLNFKQESVNLFPRMLSTYLNEQGNLLTHFRLLYLVCT